MPLGKRKRNLFDSSSNEPYKLSRSKIEDFVRCRRCFYLDRRLGIGKPSMPGWTLNSAVDHLLKKEFDIYRAKGEPHPLMIENHVDAIPFAHSDLEEWRENFKGVQFHHKPTNLIIHGAIDDIWITPNKELIVVDYKATSINGEVTLEGEYKEAYKRQMEIYQWLFRQSGFEILDTGYFVYANGRKDREGFFGRLDFDITLLPYKGNDAWVEPAVVGAWECLKGEKIPNPNDACEYCAFREAET